MPALMNGYSMLTLRTTMVIACLAVLQPSAAEPGEVYRWVDENGVVNFSDRAPPAAPKTGVSTLTLEDSRPAADDAEQDLFNIQATLARTQALREELQEQRAARRELRAAQPVAVQYPEPSNTGYSWGHPYGFPPMRPHPPERPQPEPPADDTATWRPPGRSGDP